MLKKKKNHILNKFLAYFFCLLFFFLNPDFYDKYMTMWQWAADIKARSF